MDDEALYGKELFVINFSEAVKRGLLVDYKVIVLAVDEATVSRKLQNLLKDPNNSLRVDDATKIIGCWKALSKQGLTEDLSDDFAPMQRAVAFCQVIEEKPDGKIHKISSKQIAGMFQQVVEAYQRAEKEEQEQEKRNGETPAKSAEEKHRDDIALNLVCKAEHVDGGMNATAKEEKLAWLKKAPPENTCHILSNVRCLSEGVDVPALDAVLFLTPRNSQVDVVQSVGRVMRNAPGKKRGYIILPVVIPAGIEPHKALDDNKNYAVVWQVLQALRSHDDRFDAMINRLELNGSEPDKMEIIAVSDRLVKRTAKKDDKTARAKRTYGIGEKTHSTPAETPQQGQFEFEIGEIERAIYAKLVKKVGNRHHWEEWANDIAKIAQTHIDRIRGILENPANTREKQTFNQLAEELRDDLNGSITNDEIIEMLAQHLITRPVFDALFGNDRFAAENPISKALQNVLDILQEHRLDKETTTLTRFYDSVKLRAQDINTLQGKQKIIVELYDKFFRGAFPKMTEKLGIVYTPVEVVDFIIHSVAHILQTEFGQTLGSKGIHILDPFTGTGTFITRLLQSGLIKPDELPDKYRHDIHANEIVLLAYYIAAINIETTYHTLTGGDYLPFEGICLTDTFQLSEKEDLIDTLLVENSARRKQQKALDIRVIIGNPPYSIGQKSENDNNQNIAYPKLDTRIRQTYAAKSSAGLNKGVYDSYIRAIRWASDRIGESGVIGFVCGNAWIERSFADGMRKCLVEEFSSLYIFNLRGDIRKNMLSKGRAQEGENVFGNKSMTGILIMVLVKNPLSEKQGKIYYHNIGNNLKEQEKLEKIAAFGDIDGIAQTNGWKQLVPDAYGDWLNQRDPNFSHYLVLGNKKGIQEKLFDNFSQGILTARDAWCYNASQQAVAANMQRMIGFYNTEREHFNTAYGTLDKTEKTQKIDAFIESDSRKISWTHNLKQMLLKDTPTVLNNSHIVPSLYRPFTKQWLYFDRQFNERVYQMPRIFPDVTVKNRVICVSGTGTRSGFSVLMTKELPCYDMIEKGQCFPLWLYEPATSPDKTGASPQTEMFDDTPEKGLFDNGQPTYTRKDAITDAGLVHFRNAYPGETLSKEDIFYYVYGLLHSEDYRTRYADNLMKELPHIPCVKTAAAFRRFSEAGRQLAELHLSYETVTPYPLQIDGVNLFSKPEDYRVTKMRYGGKTGKEKDLTTILYNDRITLRGIPLEAYDYIVNGKPALDWVVERQAVTTDKASGIVNDANDWAIHTMHNPKYPLELIQRIITVSLETMKIVRNLPELDI